MEFLELKILEMRNLQLKSNAHQQQERHVKLKVGFGKMGGWLKQYSSNLPSSHFSLNSNGRIDIYWNWTFPLRYKQRYQYLYIKLVDDGFLGSVIGECMIDIGHLKYPSTHSLCAPIISNVTSSHLGSHFMNIGEIHLSISTCPKSLHIYPSQISNLERDEKNDVPMTISTDTQSNDQMVPVYNNSNSNSSSTHSFKEQLKESISSASHLIIGTIKNGIRMGSDLQCLNGESRSQRQEMKEMLLREENNSKPFGSNNDHIHLIVVNCTGLEKEYSPPVGLGCRIRVGSTEKKETHQKLSNNLVWKQYFDLSLSNPMHRFSLSMQIFTVQLLDFSTTPASVMGESKEINLYALERDKVLEMSIPIKMQLAERPIINNNLNNVSIKIFMKFTTGNLTENDTTELLYQSVCAQDTHLTNALLRKGAKFNHYFKENRHLEQATYTTPLIKASKHGNIGLIRALIELGASVNYADPDGYTPLMKTLQFEGIHQPSSIHVLRLLLDSGANPSLRNKYGNDIFSYCNNKETIQFLQSYIYSSFMEVTILKCPRCNYIEFPFCSETTNPILRDRNCRCTKLSNCLSCNYPLSTKDEYIKVISNTEIKYLMNSFSSIVRFTPQFMIHCSSCNSFGFISQHMMDCQNDDDQFENYILNHLSHLPPCSNSTSTKIHYSKVILLQKQLDILLQLSPKTRASRSITITYQLYQKQQKQQHITTDYSPFQTLPHELILAIFSQIDSWSDISSLIQVNSLFHNILNDNMFWKNKLCSLFSLSRQTPLFGNSFKSLYGHYTSMAEWIRILLLEETFKPKYKFEINVGNGSLNVELSLTAKKYLFNKDGSSFNFENEFRLVLEFSAIKQLESVVIKAFDQPIQKIAELCSLIGISSANEATSPSLEQIGQHNGNASIHLRLQQKAITRWINQYLKYMYPGFHNFLMIRDDVGGSIILDFFYYDIERVELLLSNRQPQQLNL
ncbi:ankyrin repeat-containing protein [Heterostelium album PN500]|uniref:Ankyrin repeat-containing protein n=1 Tax=Heterostelium pallidum (strain ATCC 26659 / Pp 5 / PN500) TaxID=670386 RepID=D3B4Q1_HETP5|nr:ankyrin repeat-containing protein [Heterostelium album PN500]EFA84299.1 ankyrin repeat-containing protein [Heterostelium album PN500]|eukprot:XP_020436415.1 ankyrin repeat-containing protein [Heterostelium album PN500]